MDAQKFPRNVLWELLEDQAQVLVLLELGFANHCTGLQEVIHSGLGDLGLPTSAIRSKRVAVSQSKPPSMLRNFVVSAAVKGLLPPLVFSMSWVFRALTNAC